MGQINLTQITNQNEIIIPPSGVDGLYNEGGTLYVINSSGASYSLVSATGVSGTGIAGQSAYWVSPNVLGGRANNFSKVNSFITGSSSTQIAITFSYAGGSFAQNDILTWNFLTNVLTAPTAFSNGTMSVWVNTTPDLTGSPQLISNASINYLSRWRNDIRHIYIGATASYCYNTITNTTDDWDETSNPQTTLNINWAAQQYFIVSIVGLENASLSISTKLEV